MDLGLRHNEKLGIWLWRNPPIINKAKGTRKRWKYRHRVISARSIHLGQPLIFSFDFNGAKGIGDFPQPVANTEEQNIIAKGAKKYIRPKLDGVELQILDAPKGTLDRWVFRDISSLDNIGQNSGVNPGDIFTGVVNGKKIDFHISEWGNAPGGSNSLVKGVGQGFKKPFVITPAPVVPWTR